MAHSLDREADVTVTRIDVPHEALAIQLRLQTLLTVIIEAQRGELGLREPRRTVG